MLPSGFVTLDEALAAIDGAGPFVEFSAQQRAIPEVVAAIEGADVASDPAQLIRVHRLLHKASHYLVANALASCWVRAALTLGHHADVAQTILTSPYPNRFFQGARSAGPAAWPLVRHLIEHRSRLRWAAMDPSVELASALVAPAVPGCEARFSELCSLSTSLAARALSKLRWPANGAIAERLAALVPAIATADGGDVVAALRAAAEGGEALAAIEAAIDDAVLAGPHAAEVAYALTLSSVRTGTPARYLADPRPAVRIGVVRALAKDPRLGSFARDPDPAVRSAAIAALGRRGVAADEVPSLVSALEVAGAELAGLLVVAVEEAALLAACDTDGGRAARELAAALRRQHGRPTRACARCKQLRRSADWSSASDMPAVLGELAVVRATGTDDDEWKLVRCPTCSAVYVVTYWGERDVNSMHESWTLRRLTLGEIRRDHGEDFVPDWSAALVADLDHPDPHWRTEAANELARDLVAARQFDRIEGELLRHATREVPREALRILHEQAIDAPVSTGVLELLAASADDATRASAAALLAVRQGARALDELQLDSPAEIARAELLLRRGVAASARFAAYALDRALTATYRWQLDPVVERAAFTAEHLPATLARLRAALDVAATRRRALELTERLAKQSLLDDATRAIALAQGDTELAATLAVALAEPRPLPPALATAALRAGHASAVVPRLTESLTRGEDLRWAIPALGAAVRSHAEEYDSAPLLHELAKRGIDLTDAVPDLTAALDAAMGYSAQYSAHALIRQHLGRGEIAAAIAILSHPLATIRGAAASVLEDPSIVLPDPVVARLRELAAEPAWYPRGAAERALRVRAAGG